MANVENPDIIPPGKPPPPPPPAREPDSPPATERPSRPSAAPRREIPAYREPFPSYPDDPVEITPPSAASPRLYQRRASPPGGTRRPVGGDAIGAVVVLGDRWSK